MSQIQLSPSKRGVREILIRKTPSKFQMRGVQISTATLRTTTIKLNCKYQYTNPVPPRQQSSTYVKLMKGRLTTTLPLSTFMEPPLSSIHKILSPLYVLLVIFGSVLTANLWAISTPFGFYEFLGNLGVVLTIIGAIVYLHYTYKKL